MAELYLVHTKKQVPKYIWQTLSNSQNHWSRVASIRGSFCQTEAFLTRSPKLAKNRTAFPPQYLSFPPHWGQLTLFGTGGASSGESINCRSLGALKVGTASRKRHSPSLLTLVLGTVFGATPRYKTQNRNNKNIPNALSYTVPSTRVRREGERRFLDVVPTFSVTKLLQFIDSPEPAPPVQNRLSFPPPGWFTVANTVGFSAITRFSFSVVIRS